MFNNWFPIVFTFLSTVFGAKMLVKKKAICAKTFSLKFFQVHYMIFINCTYDSFNLKYILKNHFFDEIKTLDSNPVIGTPLLCASCNNRFVILRISPNITSSAPNCTAISPNVRL